MSLREKILILVLAAMLGGGGSFVYRQISPPAPDRFTGADGAKMEQRLSERMTNHEARISSLEGTASRLLEGIDQLIDSTHRIEIQVAKLPPDEWRERIRNAEKEITLLKRQKGE